MTCCMTEVHVVCDVQCWVQRCVAEGQSLQNRTARCTAERNATYVSDSLCDVRTRPAVTRVCENALCQPVWNTSEWSAVSQHRACSRTPAVRAHPSGVAPYPRCLLYTSDAADES